MQSRTERLAPLSGIGYVLLYVIGFLITLPDSPDFTDNPSKYVPYYVDHKSDIMLGGVALLLAGVLLLWFFGSIRAASAAAEGGEGRVSAIGFAGGVIGIGMYIVGVAAFMLPALRLDNDQKLTVETAMTFQDLGSVLLGMAVPIGFGVLFIATAVVGFRHGVIPKWWAWITVIVGVAMLVPFISFAVVFVLFPIWVLVMSVMLLRAKAPAGV